MGIGNRPEYQHLNNEYQHGAPVTGQPVGVSAGYQDYGVYDSPVAASAEAHYGVPLAFEPSWDGVKTVGRSCNNAIFGVLFILTILTFAGIGAYFNQYYYSIGAMDFSAWNGNDITPTPDTSPVSPDGTGLGISCGTWTAGLLTATGVATLLAIGWMAMLKHATKFTIYASVITYLGLLLLAGLALMMVNIIFGVLTLFVVACLAVYVYLNRHMIDFCVVLVQQTVIAIQDNPAIHLLISPMMALLQIGAAVGVIAGSLWVYAVNWDNPKRTSTESNFAIAFILFTIFVAMWVSEFLMAATQFSMSTIFSQWYFTRSENKGVGSAARAGRALKWSFTTSFGTICLGSLILAIIRFCRFLLSIAENRAREGGGIAGLVMCFIFCCIRFICSILEGIIRYINRYVYIYAGMYGYAFCDGAREVFNLFERTLLHPILNDVIVNMVIAAGTLLLVSISAGASTFAVWLSGGLHGAGYVPILLGSICALFILHYVAVAFQLGVDTLFVCYAEDLERNAHTRQYHFSMQWHQAIIERENCPASIKRVEYVPSV